MHARATHVEEARAHILYNQMAEVNFLPALNDWSSSSASITKAGNYQTAYDGHWISDEFSLKISYYKIKLFRVGKKPGLIEEAVLGRDRVGPGGRTFCRRRRRRLSSTDVQLQ